MNYSKKMAKKAALFLVALMLAIIPNMKVYSAIGNYQTSSQAIIANQNYNHPAIIDPDAGWPALALAVVAGAGLGVTFATGVVSGWNSVHAIDHSASVDFSTNDSRYDYSRFDN